MQTIARTNDLTDLLASSHVSQAEIAEFFGISGQALGRRLAVGELDSLDTLRCLRAAISVTEGRLAALRHAVDAAGLEDY